MSSSEVRISGLEGLRAIAVVWIVIFHWMSMYLHSAEWAPADLRAIETDAYSAVLYSSPFFRVVRAGERSVDIFMVLSAFLYFRASDRRTQQQQTGPLAGITVRILSRWLRLFPAHGFVMFVCAALDVYGMRRACPAALPSHLVFAQNVIPGGLSCLLFTWSTAVDMQFHAIAGPLLESLLSRAASASPWLILDVGFLASLAIRFTIKLGLGDPSWASSSLATKMCAYVAGAAAWVVISSKGQPESGDAHRSGLRFVLSHPNTVYLAPASALVFACVWDPWAPAGAGSNGIASALSQPLFALGAARVVVAASGRQNDTSYAWLRWRGFRPFATLSYAAFLFQHVTLAVLSNPDAWVPNAGLINVLRRQVVNDSLSRALKPPLEPDSFLAVHVAFTLTAVLLVVLTFAGGAVVHSLIERPALRLRIRILRALIDPGKKT